MTLQNSLIFVGQFLSDSLVFNIGEVSTLSCRLPRAPSVRRRLCVCSADHDFSPEVALALEYLAAIREPHLSCRLPSVSPVRRLFR